MNKQEFLAALREGLQGLPQDDIEERVGFYAEMIDDRTEEGVSEEAAVAALEDVKEIATRTMAEIPLTKLVKEKVKPRRTLRAWEIILLAVGSPIWASLLLAAAAVFFSVYAAIWSVILAIWAAEAAIGVGALCGIAAGSYYALQGYVPTGVLLIGCGIFCAGLVILGFMGCKAGTKGMILLSKKIVLAVKALCKSKEGAR